MKGSVLSAVPSLFFGVYFEGAKDSSPVDTSNVALAETTLIQRLTDRVTVGDTDIGARLKSSINDLYDLLSAYRSGLVKEKG